MKTFTAKQFSRAPAQVFEAAREDGEVEITHDRFRNKFALRYIFEDYEDDEKPNEKGPEGPDSEQ